MSHISSSAFSDTKAHYDLLDGLRGVAALMVIWYHIFEGYAFAGGSIIETFNHGYLAVDFFFILSGFVIGLPVFLVLAEMDGGVQRVGKAVSEHP